MLIINEEYYRIFLQAIKNAKSSICGFIYHDSVYISVAGSKADDYIFALKEAHVRGVSIKILCQSDLQIKKFRPFVSEIKTAKGFKTMHSKAFCFDNEFLILGSHNFTDNAVTKNLEMSTILTDKNDILRFNNYFETVWQK